MTKQRFTEIISTGIVIDHQTNKEYSCEYRIDDEFLKLVNNLAEENKSLRKEIECMMDLLDFSGIQYHISDDLEFILD